MKILYFILFAVLFSSSAFGRVGLRDCALTPSEAEDSLIEHVYGGAPDDSELFERRAYVLAYNKELRVPKWAAWHAVKEYRDTPTRESRWSAFRTDPELPQVVDRDYVGWYDSDKNYARGHIVPYFISGGDRDDDGKDAEYEDSLRVEDKDDACTVFEINALSNIAPQYHNAFNGSPGLWWQLESDVRHIVDSGTNLQLFAGTIFKDGVDIEKIGNRRNRASSWKIGVPHGFFKIVINPIKEQAVAFLFDHSADLENGCNIGDDTVKWPSQCIVDIEEIEQATGLKFFKNFDEEKNSSLRGASENAVWMRWLNSGGY